MAIEIRLLGGFSARRDGEEIAPAAFGGRLTRRLVRVLVTRLGSFVPRDTLTEALWPRTPPADPTLNLNVLVNRARSALGDGLIVTGSGGYSFARTERCIIDAEQFLVAVESGRELLSESNLSAALAALRSGLDAWGGEPLPEDAYEDWAQEYRAILLRARLDALELGAEAALQAGDPRQAIAFAELAVMQEPLREPAHLLVARALAVTGDAAGALAAVDRLRRRLADELGLDPSAEADALQTRILRGEGLGFPRSAPGIALRTRLERLPFVGREDQLGAMLDGLRDDLPQPVVISGPAGAGKSRLLEEFALRCPRPVLAARASPAEAQDAWALARSLLREVLALDVDAARAVPERAAGALCEVFPDLAQVRPSGALADDSESRRALALEGATRMVEHAAARGGIALIADDLQWADATSVAWLGRLADRAPQAGLIVAYRPEDVSTDGPVASFLAQLGGSRGDRLEVCLGPLAAAAIAELVEDEEVVQAIVVETDATPLAVSEVLGALAARGALEAGPRGGWRAAVPGVGEIAQQAARAGQRRSIRARIRRHPPEARQLLALLALCARESPARLLAAATQQTEAVVLGELESLARASLVRLGERGWRTDHDVVGEVVIGELNGPEAARLHGLLAKALRDPDGDPADWGRHVLGAGDPEGAAEAFADAARARLERFANDEAERLASAGLDLCSRPGARSHLYELRAEARDRIGDLSGGTDDLRAALVGRASGPGRSEILVGLAMLTSGPEDYLRARDLVNAALTEAGDDPAARARALAAGSRLDLNLNQLETAEALAGEALQLFDGLGDAYGIAEALDTRAVIVAHSGRIREASTQFQQVARRFEDLGRLLRVGMPRASHGHGLILMGRPADGLVSIEEALELERTLAHPEGEAYCLWLRSEALAALGRGADARRSADASLSIARRLGHREWTAAALKGLGAACLADGDLEGAEAASRACLETAQRLPIFSSWAASQLASALIRKGEPASAEPYVRLALGDGTPLTQYEARLVEAELVFMGGNRDASALAARALHLAEDGGHLQSAGRLRSLLRDTMFGDGRAERDDERGAGRRLANRLLQGG